MPPAAELSLGNGILLEILLVLQYVKQLEGCHLHALAFGKLSFGKVGESETVGGDEGLKERRNGPRPVATLASS